MCKFPNSGGKDREKVKEKPVNLIKSKKKKKRRKKEAKIATLIEKKLENE